MNARLWVVALLSGGFCLTSLANSPTSACCAVGPSGKPIVNADQTVIILWDAANKTQHFIRRASFVSESDVFGFLIPSPSEPELSESGNEAFPYLQKLTEPEIVKRKLPSGEGGCACAGGLQSRAPTASVTDEKAIQVHVLQEKLVAGYKASVLQATSAAALTSWLKTNGYAYSPEVAAWAKPYVDAGWKFTALKVAREKGGAGERNFSADALRMTFKTEKPLFPYREPDSGSFAQALGQRSRLLRIYFIADGRYDGELTPSDPWTGKAAWSNELSAINKEQVLALLKLPEATGPEKWWMTEFEDQWPYRVAPADVYFSRSADQSMLKRPPIIQYVSASWPEDSSAYALAALLVLPPIYRRLRRRQ